MKWIFIPGRCWLDVTGPWIVSTALRCSFWRSCTEPRLGVTCTVENRLDVNPSLPQPVTFPGRMMYERDCKQYIFRSYNIYFQCYEFWWRISHFYGSFWSDFMAVKELKAVLSVSVIWFDHLSLMLRMRVSCRVLGSLLPFFDCFANRILLKIRTSVIPCSPLWQ